MPSADATRPVSAHTGGRTDPPAFGDRPDEFFALVAGLYAGVLVAPVATAAVARTVGDPAMLYLVLLAGITLVTAVTAVAVRRIRGLPERLGGTRVRWLPAVVAPAAVVVAGVVLVTVDGYASIDGPLGVVAGVGGFTTGGALGIMARSRYTKAITGAVESQATWRASWPDRRRRPLWLLGIAAVAGGLLALVAQLVWRHTVLRILGQLLVPVGAIVFTVGQARTYRATSAGLEEQMPAARTLYRWDRFEGYAVDDDAIVLHRREPWRFSVVCARADLDDGEGVVAALDRYLPRVEA